MSEAAGMVSPSWHEFGETSNARFFVVEEGIVAVVPHPDSTDTTESAQASLEMQHRHWQEVGRGGVAIIMIDALIDQNGGARHVYRTEPNPKWARGFALVTESAFGRLVASVFLGISRPPVATKMFKTVASAVVWAREVNARTDEAGDD